MNADHTLEYLVSGCIVYVTLVQFVFINLYISVYSRVTVVDNYQSASHCLFIKSVLCTPHGQYADGSCP